MNGESGILQALVCQGLIHQQPSVQLSSILGKTFWYYPAILKTPFKLILNFKYKIKTTFDNGSLGSRNDEERSEMRYVM
jgi:hypothetical protein